MAIIVVSIVVDMTRGCGTRFFFVGSRASVGQEGKILFTSGTTRAASEGLLIQQY